MDRPAQLVFSDEASFTLARGEILLPLVIGASGFIAAMLTTEASVTDLALPFAAMSAGWLGWTGLFGLIAWAHRFGEKRAINRMFAGDIWERWQFSASDWQALVEAECDLISPSDEGPKAYVGAVYSSLFGLILAIIIGAVAVFAIDAPEIKTALLFTAVGVFLLLAGIGLFQPSAARYKANLYRRKCLRIADPRVWFAPDGIYHEALGYTSLKELNKVTDQTRSRKTIQFTLAVSTESSADLVALPFPVPAGCEERAGRLVHRYRQERVNAAAS